MHAPGGPQRRAAEIGFGRWRVCEVDHEAVLAISYDWDGRTVVVIGNFSDRTADVTVPVSDDLSHAVGLLRTDAVAVAGGELPRHGFRWLRLT